MSAERVICHQCGELVRVIDWGGPLDSLEAVLTDARMRGRITTDQAREWLDLRVVQPSPGAADSE